MVEIKPNNNLNKEMSQNLIEEGIEGSPKTSEIVEKKVEEIKVAVIKDWNAAQERGNAKVEDIVSGGGTTEEISEGKNIADETGEKIGAVGNEASKKIDQIEQPPVVEQPIIETKSQQSREKLLKSITGVAKSPEVGAETTREQKKNLLIYQLISKDMGAKEIPQNFEITPDMADIEKSATNYLVKKENFLQACKAEAQAKNKIQKDELAIMRNNHDKILSRSMDKLKMSVADKFVADKTKLLGESGEFTEEEIKKMMDKEYVDYSATVMLRLASSLEADKMQTEMEGLNHRERGMMSRMMEKYSQMPQWKRLTVSCAISAGIGAGIVAFGTGGAIAAAVAYGAARAGRTAAGGSIAAGLRYISDKVIGRKYEKQREAVMTAQQQETLKKLQTMTKQWEKEGIDWKENEEKKMALMCGVDQDAQKVNNVIAPIDAKERKAKKWATVVSGLAGGVSVMAASMDWSSLISGKPSGIGSAVLGHKTGVGGGAASILEQKPKTGFDYQEVTSRWAGQQQDMDIWMREHGGGAIPPQEAFGAGVAKAGVEHLQIGARGPEGAIIDYFKEHSDVAKQFGWDGTTDINKWAGTEAHKLWLEQAGTALFKEAKSALNNPEIITEMKAAGYPLTLEGYTEMMTKIGKGTVSLDIVHGKIGLGNMEYLKHAGKMATGEIPYAGPEALHMPGEPGDATHVFRVVEQPNAADIGTLQVSGVGESPSIPAQEIFDQKNVAVNLPEVKEALAGVSGPAHSFKEVLNQFIIQHDPDKLQIFLDSPRGKIAGIVNSLERLNVTSKNFEIAANKIGGMEKLLDAKFSDITNTHFDENTNAVFKVFSNKIQRLFGGEISGDAPIRDILKNISSKNIFEGNAQDLIQKGLIK